MGSRTRNTIPKQPRRERTVDLQPAATPERTAEIAARLAELWPDAVVELDHRNAYQLLVATILAAQSTDKMINTLTPALFAKYPDAASLARADQAELEPMIFSSGFYRAKARNLIGMAQAVVERHGGEVPDTMEGLVELPGVARKTANVVLGSALGKNEGIVVDTHVSRLAPRLGLTTETDPVKIEQDLMKLVPRDQWSIFAHRLIWHGRRVCHAKQPACDQCALAPLCPSAHLFGTPALMPPRNGRPAPPSRAAQAQAAEARRAAGGGAKPAGAKLATASPASAKLPAARLAAAKLPAAKLPTAKPPAVKPPAVKSAAVKSAAVKSAAVKGAAARPGGARPITARAGNAAAVVAAKAGRLVKSVAASVKAKVRSAKEKRA